MAPGADAAARGCRAGLTPLPGGRWLRQGQGA